MWHGGVGGRGQLLVILNILSPFSLSSRTLPGFKLAHGQPKTRHDAWLPLQLGVAADEVLCNRREQKWLTQLPDGLLKAGVRPYLLFPMGWNVDVVAIHLGS